MDDVVRRAMAKWPNVPAVFGWLALDLRGRWLLRGETISNPLVIEFIGRNYARDEHGRWFFQNGPQRVFVALAYAPWVLRVDPAGRLVTHTGLAVTSLRSAAMDREGVLVLETEHGAGVVDDKDAEAITPMLGTAGGEPLDDERIEQLLDDIQQGKDAPLFLRYAGASVAVVPVRRDDVPARFGFVREPQPLPHERSAG